MTRQTSIPGTDVDNPEVRDCIERWLEACERAKAASEKKQELDDAIVLTMLRLGVAYHPYTDPESGKRKYRVVDTTPRGKSVGARPQPVEAMEPDEPSESESTPVQTTTHRKVSRAKAERDIAAAKPKREKKRDPNADAIDGALRPARDWDAEA